MKVVVDRIEKDFAVVEQNGESMADIPLSELPEGIKEGDVLDYDGKKYTVNKAEGAEKRKRIEHKIESLFID